MLNPFIHPPLEQSIYKKPIEHKGNVWLWEIIHGRYIKLSPEDVPMYRRVKKRKQERKMAESPKEVARREQENQKFMQGFKIVFVVDSLVKRLQLNEDPRLEEILDVKKGAEEGYWKTGKNLIEAEQFKGEAVLTYVEAHHLDLYGFLQNACPWLRRN